MHNSVNNLISIKKEIQLKKNKTNIIAVSKTFPLNNILPLINYGHEHYGENKVQEAIEKWTSIKYDFKNKPSVQALMLTLSSTRSSAGVVE